MNALTWRLATPANVPGAIAVIQLDGPLGAACAAAGVGAMNPGDVRVRDLLGIDTGVAAAWSETCLHLMPHGGVAVVRALTAELLRRGVAQGAGTDPRVEYPEARDDIEAHMLAAVARAASPLAIDMLLDQPRRWRGGGDADASRDRVLNRLIDPPLVVAVGPPNVGKSTLVNALARRHVSIVADVAGTTRDHVGVTLDIGGLVIRYIDTPGLDEWPGPTHSGPAAVVPGLVAHADLVLECVDATAPVFALPAAVAASALRVNLRSDLGCVEADLAVSVTRGEGLGELAGIVRERLVPAAVLAHPGPWRFWEECGLN